MQRLAILGAVSLFAAAACGSGGSDTTSPTSLPPVDPPTDSTTADTAPPETSLPANSPELPAPLAATAQRAAPSDEGAITELVAGFNNAGFDLWRTQPVDDNIVFSPTSIGHALLLARGAADEPTGAAIDAGFTLPEGLAAHVAWNAVDQQVASQTDAGILRIADRIWPDTSTQPSQEWIDLLAAYHGADVSTLPLRDDSEGSRKIINDWVSEQTETLIPELVPPGMIDASTALILTDAVYFEAKWATLFGKYGTETRDFTNLDGSTTQVSLMNELELSDLRGTGDGFVGAEIPYAGNAYSMLVIVPDQGRFTEIRDGLDQSMLDDINATFTTGPYQLLLPKWASDYDLDLLPYLTKMGAAPGNYPAIAPGVSLGGAVHAADIAVDEVGTVAAAATALSFLESGPPEPELTVAADQPFLYLIRHRPSGLVLFAGQVVNAADISS